MGFILEFSRNRRKNLELHDRVRRGVDESGVVPPVFVSSTPLEIFPPFPCPSLTYLDFFLDNFDGRVQLLQHVLEQHGEPELHRVLHGAQVAVLKLSTLTIVFF